MADSCEQRASIKLCFKLGKTATECYEMLKTAFGEQAMGRSQTFQWFSRFKAGRTTHGCSTLTMRQPMLPSWLDGFWPITTWLRCHIPPTCLTLHPATFSCFQSWKWSLRGEDFAQRKFKQSHRPSWTRYEKMTSKNASKTGSATGIVVKPQKGATLKVMPAPNV